MFTVVCLFLSTFCPLSTLHIIHYISTTLFLPLYFLSQYDTNLGPETAEIKIKMIIHYENKLTNCQLAPITFSLAQFSIDTSIHLRGLVASVSYVENCKKTLCPLASGDDDFLIMILSKFGFCVTISRFVEYVGKK